MTATVFAADPPEASMPGPITEYRRSASVASISDIAPFCRLWVVSRSSSALASTSTIAFPIAVTSNVRLFIKLLGKYGLTVDDVATDEPCRPARPGSGALKILSDERRQFPQRLGRNRIGPRDQRELERRRTFARPLERQPIDRIGDDPLRRPGVLREVTDDHLDGDGVVLGMPAVVIGHQRNCRVADLRLARQLGFLQVGHADDVGAPRAIEMRLGEGRELRPLHADVGPTLVHRRARLHAALVRHAAEQLAEGVGEADVGHETAAEEGADTPAGAVDELIGDDDVERLVFLLEAADGAGREDVLHPQ